MNGSLSECIKKAVWGGGVGVAFVAFYFVIVILGSFLGPYVKGVGILAGFGLGGERLAYNGWFLFFFPFLFYTMVGFLSALSFHLARRHGPFLSSWPMSIRAITKGAVLGFTIYLGLLFLSLGFGRWFRYLLFLPGRITGFGIGRDDLANSISFVLAIGFFLFAIFGASLTLRFGIWPLDKNNEMNRNQEV